MLPRLQEEVTRLLKLLLARIIETKVIKLVGEEKQLLTLGIQKFNHLKELHIGHKTWDFISREEDSIDASVN